ncbi:gfo/Idh/MocA family oxidoreductase [Capnocytophaga felis]|uniref:Gfo/Idh/MocA-like oxidoreductase N-terminal domain-containing protein n=1 Tax=Capnocytophaga felis TaxID=2267611 RepID=A0A5M4B6P4_9FLAO|nr:gfo/Idh/MocA family oxidoreductase [Capnocytophaga felis]GET45284.1 hypothetical protein RCZ01_05860 [Capnocytophaga felis]GET47553.1 hypothetical protein RCZ02_03840 [Capnocytophaga felis]
MEKIWLIGTGNIAVDYAKVLKGLNIDYIAIGRGRENVRKFELATEHTVIEGGIENYIALEPEKPSHAIVAVNVEALAATTEILLNFGIKNILLEKPGICTPNEIDKLVDLTKKMDANVLLAYNRRFYASIFKAEEMIKNDGGITSLIFEFTEWGHEIEKLYDGGKRFNYWFLGNSSHVVDLAFFLAGKPTSMSSFQKGGTNWHPKGAIYSGAGMTDKEVLFSYHANWNSPGRWFVEICTPKHRLYFKPMETLQIQNIGSVAVNPVEIDDLLDKKYKPGLYLQTKAFLENDLSRFYSVEDQKKMIEDVYLKICKYH